MLQMEIARCYISIHLNKTEFYINYKELLHLFNRLRGTCLKAF